jgi:RimJ/RimL family protein N-acetyltransferase
MNNKVILEPLDVNNWLKICDLSVSDEQKQFFCVPNVYWIGISRYEEKSELFAIKAGDKYVGLIGGGFDEDGVTGYINPLMIDQHHQGKGYAKEALILMIEYLRKNLGVKRININHSKANAVAGKLYNSLGFVCYGEDDKEYLRKLE